MHAPLQPRLVTTTIPKGTLLYHGTQSPENFDLPDGPAWFSDQESVARTFVTWHHVGGGKRKKRPRILVTKVIRPLSKLWLVRTSLEFKRWIEKIGDGHIRGHRRTTSRWSPGGDSDLWVSGDGPEIAAACCEAGYSGWHMPTNYQDGSDTLICDPARFLDLVRIEAL